MYLICWIFEDEADLGNVAYAYSLKPDAFYYLMYYDIYNKDLVIRYFFGGSNEVDENLHFSNADHCGASYV